MTNATGEGPIEDFGGDRSVVEACSWRLASELHRRHPHTVRMFLTHPGGGMYDCLTFRAAGGAPGSIQLNREGTIQVHERFDGREPTWPMMPWDTYYRADPRLFLYRLEAEAGLPAPSSVPVATPTTLTLRVLAAIAATGLKSVEPISIHSGFYDTSGYGGGPFEDGFAAFPAIPPMLREIMPDDEPAAPEQRFWFVQRAEELILAFEQHHGLAWTRHHQNTWDLMDLYKESRRHLLVTALKLLRRVDHI